MTGNTHHQSRRQKAESGKCQPPEAGFPFSVFRFQHSRRTSRRARSPGHVLLAVVIGLLAWFAHSTGLSAPLDSGRAADPIGATSGNIRLRVAGAQIPVSRDGQKNVEALTRAIQFAAREKADVLVTPEGSLSGYTHKFDATATARAMETVTRRAREANVALVLGTCFADTNGTLYDAQRFYDRRGNFLGFHAKILLCRRVAEPGRKGELDHFKSAPLRTFALQGLTVGGLVCNDMWANPEWTPMPDPFLARQLAGLGARVIFLSVNAGQDAGEDWPLNHAFHDSNLRLRARSAGVWVIVADAADPEGRKPSNCPSGVVRPDGRWAVRAEPRGEQFFAHTIEVEPAR